MTVATSLKKIKGFDLVGEADPDTDLQDLFTDRILRMRIILDAAAGADYTKSSFKVPFAMVIREAVILPGAGLTASAADYNTFTLAKADGAGGAATTMATLLTDVAGGDWVADVFKPMTNGTLAARTLTEGQLVTLKKTYAASGTVTPASTLIIRYRKV